jgi:hypothetical protein
MYFAQDFLNPKFPDHKLYLFLNSFNITEEVKKAIKIKTQKNNSVSVWFYAPGYITGNKFTPENMKDLTGINISVKNELTNITPVKVYSEKGISLKKENMFDKTYSIAPYFWVEDESAMPLVQTKEDTIVAVKEFDNWRSVYSLYPLNRYYLRALCKYAGVNIYSDSNDVLSVNGNFLMLHASKAGKKHIHLPKKFTVKEIFSNNLIGYDIDVIEDDVKFGETRIYSLHQ